MVATDPLVNFLRYVVPFCEIDTLQERGQESSSVELPIVQYVPDSFQPKQPCLFHILWELTVFEILDYRGHPGVS